MSAYTTLQTQLISARHLQQALKDVGFPDVELHEGNPQPLVGFLGEGRDLRAEVIIRRRYLGPASNDIGFARNEQGRLTALISDFDRKRFDAPWLLRVHQRYAYHVAREQLEQQGFNLVEEAVDQQNTIRLVLRRSA